MDEKILSLIYDYSVRNKLVDGEFIKNLINLFIDKKNLNRYCVEFQLFQRVVCSENVSNNVVCAIYNSDFKTIRIYMDALESSLNYTRKYEQYLSEEEIIYFRNLVITQKILSELERIYNIKVMSEQNNIESNLLKIYQKIHNNCQFSNNTSNMFGGQLDNMQILDFSLNQRLAQIRSYESVRNVAKFIEEKIPRVVMLEEYKLLLCKIYGYNLSGGYVSSPIIDSINMSGYNRELKKFSWYDNRHSECLKKCLHNHDLDERILYGLPITESEYNAMDGNVKYQLSKIKNT